MQSHNNDRHDEIIDPMSNIQKEFVQNTLMLSEEDFRAPESHSDPLMHVHQRVDALIKAFRQQNDAHDFSLVSAIYKRPNRIYRIDEVGPSITHGDVRRYILSHCHAMLTVIAEEYHQTTSNLHWDYDRLIQEMLVMNDHMQILVSANKAPRLIQNREINGHVSARGAVHAAPTVAEQPEEVRRFLAFMCGELIYATELDSAAGFQENLNMSTSMSMFSRQGSGRRLSAGNSILTPLSTSHARVGGDRAYNDWMQNNQRSSQNVNSQLVIERQMMGRPQSGASWRSWRAGQSTGLTGSQDVRSERWQSSRSIFRGIRNLCSRIWRNRASIRHRQQEPVNYDVHRGVGRTAVDLQRRELEKSHLKCMLDKIDGVSTTAVPRQAS